MLGSCHRHYPAAETQLQQADRYHTRYTLPRQKGSVNTTKDLSSNFQAESLCSPVTQSTRSCLLVLKPADL